MFTVFLILQVIITLALVILILVQRNDSDGLGSMGGGGGGNAFMTGRGQANLMTRTTAILATLFMVNSLWLAYLASGGRSEHSSIADEIAAQEAETMSVPLADEPAAGGMKELLEPEMPVTSTPKDPAPIADEPAAAAPQAEEGAAPAVPIP